MNTNTQIDKIDKVLSKISGKEMKGFVRQYAATHEDFATALVEKYWKPERGNYKEQVEACFAHAGESGKRYRYYIQKADYWAAHGKRAKAEKLMWEKRDDENIRDHYIDSLIEWGEYKKAVEVIDDNKDDFHSYSKKWEDKVVKALKQSGDKEWLIEECKKRFIVSGYRIKYYEALKEVIDRNEWPAFFDELWKMPDWEHDYEDAEAKILIKEERLDLLKDMFVHKHWNLWELYPEYIKYVPKQDHAFVGEILFKDIKRLALLKEKPKEFNWLLGQIERVMRKSAAVDKMIKNGIRQLIADYPDKYYFKSYLGSIL